MDTALVLSGGGAKGAFQAGALQVLAQMDYEYQSVAGVSVGALNGVMVAAQKVERMINIWQSITQNDVYKKRSIPLLAAQYVAHKIGIWSAPESAYSNEPLFELLKRELDDIALQIPLTIGRVNIETGEYISAIDPQSSDFSKQVLASTAIPVVWEPVTIEGEKFIDGGIRNTTPLKDVIRSNPHRIIVITNGPMNMFEEKKGFKDIVDVAERSLDIMLDEIFQEDLRRCIQINHLVRQAEAEGITLSSKSGRTLKEFDLTIITPPKPLGSPLDFDRERLDDLLQVGRETAAKVIGL